jgi:hypothetical protein
MSAYPSRRCGQPHSISPHSQGRHYGMKQYVSSDMLVSIMECHVPELEHILEVPRLFTTNGTVTDSEADCRIERDARFSPIP